ncbi:MAG: divergent polysaccharide deacetylase family protein [Actinomycetota bacterium]
MFSFRRHRREDEQEAPPDDDGAGRDGGTTAAAPSEPPPPADLDLDFEVDLDRLVAPSGPEPGPPSRLKTIFKVVLVLLLGGGLGAAAYYLSDVDMRDVIGLLDISDPAPKLSMQMPGRDSRRGGLLSPPGQGSDMPLQALPDEPPPDKPAEAAAPPPPAVPPASEAPSANGKTAANGNGNGNGNGKPAVAEPQPDFNPEPMAAPRPTAPPPQLAAMGGPPMPAPRPAEQGPKYDTMPARMEAKPLPAAPIKDLQRETKAGVLPAIHPDGRQSWQVYGRPFEGQADRPRVAVVVTDLGLDKAGTEAAIAKLPPEATLAFSPYATDLQKWIKKARDAGHEVLMMLPAEGSDFPARDPGPMALTTRNSPEDNVSRAEQVLAKAGGYTGVAVTGARFAASAQLSNVLSVLRERGLLYIGDGAKAGDGTPAFAPITVLADPDPWREAIDARLSGVVDTAKAKGRAVVVGSARPVTLDRLLVFMAKLTEAGIEPASASAVVEPPAKGGKS